MYDGIPFANSFVPIYTLESGCGVSVWAGVHIVLLSCAVSEVLFSVIEAIAVYMVAHKGFGRGGEEAMHKDGLLAGFVVPWAIAGGIRFFAGPGLTEPFELREPEVIFGVNFCEPPFSERDFAVIAEQVSIDGQLVPRPVVGVDGIIIREAELAAYIVLFDDRPAGLARIKLNGRGVLDAM